MKDTTSKDRPELGKDTKHMAGFAGGGTAGAILGGAAVGSVGGPGGAVIGAVAGGIIGARAGEGLAATVNPKEEDQYWRTNYSSRPYVTKGEKFEVFEPAYRAGYNGYCEFGAMKRSFDEAEPDLRRTYETGSKNSLKWDDARSAAKDAWARVESRKASIRDEET